VQAARRTVRVSAELDAVARVRIVVSDDGEGVEPEARPRIFTPFFTTRATGTGLGLMLVRRVAEAHGGDVRLADGGPERGASFVLSLPLAPAG